MTIKLEVAYGIIEAITDLRKGDDLEDFTVIVDGISVRCHRFILGACSLFFRALFRSGMKEDVEKCATLETVSHSTFTLILSALYTGCDILAEENVTDVWRAAHILEIGFLVKECENFVEQNISVDNFEKIYETAKLLDSRTVLKTGHEFMTKNFDLIRTSQTLLSLSFSEINALIKTDELVTSTEDNVVESILQWVSYNPLQTSQQEADAGVMKGLAVQSDDKDQKNQLNTNKLNKEEPINGVHGNKDSETNKEVDEHDDLHNISCEGTEGTENVQQGTGNQNIVQGNIILTHGAAIQTLATVHKGTQTSMLPEERQQRLLSLISNSRSCLLSPKCLEKLMLNPIVIDNPKVRGVVIKAVSYKLQPGYRHGQWPSAAIHRSNSQFKHVMLWAGRRNYHRDVRYRDEDINARAFFSDNDERYELTRKCSSGQITAFDNELYELNNDGLYVFRDNFWKKIVSCQLSDKTFMIPLEDMIYFLDGSNQELTSVNPKANAPVLHKHSNFPGEFTIAGDAKYHDKIIVFSVNISEEDATETIVHTFDPNNETWTRLENLKGPAKNIISFHNDENTFLLQTNGNLWKVTDDSNGSLKILFCEKAWDFFWKLYGAAIFRSKLVIFGDELPADKYVSFSLPGSKEKADPWTVKCNICSTPIILPCEYLQKTE